MRWIGVIKENVEVVVNIWVFKNKNKSGYTYNSLGCTLFKNLKGGEVLGILVNSGLKPCCKYIERLNAD